MAVTVRVMLIASVVGSEYVNTELPFLLVTFEVTRQAIGTRASQPMG